MDPVLALAYAMHSNKGAYALLLGSGVSRTASIPTGWEVTLELIRQIAHLHGESCGADPAGWYKDKYGKDADYSEVFDTLAQNPTERSQLLKRYFEPTEEEREQGLKRPTDAHRAIARLMKDGYVRVVLTTNFDRLLETALAEVGAPTPSVIASADSVEGALPLSHPGSFIIKLHGDYLDTRIKNTPEELAAYDPRMSALLDRVIDEFGVITCGWSSDWDIALKAAFERCKGRRFTTFWTHVTSLSPSAQGLVNLRGAKTLPISGADNFFIQLEEMVTSLSELDRPHPLSITSAVATVKRYVVDDKHRIRLSDLFDQETENFIRQVSLEYFPVSPAQVNTATLIEQIRRYDVVCEMLAAMLVVGCQWGEDAHLKVLTRTVERIANIDVSGGHPAFLKLRKYPALRLTCAAGLAALAADRYGTFYELLARVRVTDRLSRNAPISLRVHAGSVVEERETLWPMFNGRRPYAPLSDHLHASLRTLLKSQVSRDDEYDHLFDKFEYLYALVHASLRETNARGWVPMGRLVWRWDDAVQYGAIRQINEDIAAQRENWQLLREGLFGGSFERLEQVKAVVDEFMATEAARCV